MATTFLVFAPSLRAETLEEALVAAYSGNPALQAQRAQLRATDELVPEAKANWRPTVKVVGDIGVEQLGANTIPAPLSRNETLFARDAALDIAEPLYRGGRTDAQISQAEAQVNAGRQQLAATEQAVLLGAVTAYLDVIQDQAVVDLNKNNEQVLQRQLDATNDRFRVGEVTRTDTSQAEAAVSGAHASRRAAEGVLQDAIANYERLVGHLPKGLESVPTPADLPATSDAARSGAESNPSVLAQKYNYDAAVKGVDLAEGALLPTVTLEGSYGRTLEESYTGSGVTVGTALVNVSIPLYQQGAEYAAIRQEKHTVGQQKLQYDETLRETVEATTQAWENLQSARARVQSLEDQVKASRVALEGMQRESLVGSRTVLDVLTTEQDLLTARVNLEEARHDAVVAAYQVKSQVGQLTAQALHLSVPIYDPKANYNEVTDKWIGTGVSPSYGEIK
ncbi:MAG TPA: TolC family outer membrane protein [Magnetospirillaceae bacterium]